MPVEGQQRRPLGRRDRIVIAVVVCAAALAAGVGGYVYVGRSSGSSDEGCVVVTLPASLGGETIHRCGAAAVAFCRAEAPRNGKVADACRRAGLAVGPAPAS
jgi:hypothetical protein